MTLGRKRFWSQGDLEALIFTESGQVYMQEDGSGRERPRKAMAKGWLGGGGGGRGWLGGGGGGRGRKQASKLGRRRSLLPLSSCSQGLLAPPSPSIVPAHCGQEGSQGTSGPQPSRQMYLPMCERSGPVCEHAAGPRAVRGCSDVCEHPCSEGSLPSAVGPGCFSKGRRVIYAGRKGLAWVFLSLSPCWFLPLPLLQDGIPVQVMLSH